MSRGHVAGRPMSRTRRGRRWLVAGPAMAGLAAAGLAAVPDGAAHAATFTVCAQGCPYTQIQPAVDAAAAGGTVLVGPGTFSGGIVITKALALSGAGAGATVIAGGGPALSVSGSPVIIRRVTVTSGNAPADGGGILSTGTLTVEDSTISHNAAGGDGGGIASEGPATLPAPPASLTLRRVSVTGNASSADGGGIATYDSSARITGSTISRNAAEFEGGGIASDGGSSEKLKLISDTVRTNSAGDSGGGIEATRDATATLSGTTVDANTAASCGGGVAVFGARLVMINGQVNHNKARDCGGGIEIGGFRYGPAAVARIAGTSINGNTAGTGGGLDIGSRSTVTMTDDALSANTATSAGGGINFYSHLTMNDTSVTRNTSGGDGGGISNAGGFAVLTSDSVDANTAARHGGGLFNGFLLIRRHRFAGKMSLGPATSVSRNRAAAGGGFYVAAGTVTVIGATVTGNIPDNCQPTRC